MAGVSLTQNVVSRINYVSSVPKDVLSWYNYSKSQTHYVASGFHYVTSVANYVVSVLNYALSLHNFGS
jgi:hypothetical protein